MLESFDADQNMMTGALFVSRNQTVILKQSSKRFVPNPYSSLHWLGQSNRCSAALQNAFASATQNSQKFCCRCQHQQPSSTRINAPLVAEVLYVLILMFSTSTDCPRNSKLACAGVCLHRGKCIKMSSLLCLETRFFFLSKGPSIEKNVSFLQVSAAVSVSTCGTVIKAG